MEFAKNGCLFYHFWMFLWHCRIIFEIRKNAIVIPSIFCKTLVLWTSEIKLNAKLIHHSNYTNSIESSNRAWGYFHWFRKKTWLFYFLRRQFPAEKKKHLRKVIKIWDWTLKLKPLTTHICTLVNLSFTLPK